MLIQVTSDNHQKEVAESTQPVVIDVFATWCGPCIQMMPIVQELASELSDQYKFVKINVDEARDLAIQYGVTSIPTFVFVKDNKVMGKETGYRTKEDLKDKIKKYLG
jgi:thioredoxin 1